MSFESLPWTVDDDGGFFSHQWCDLKIVLYKLTGHFNYFFFCLFSLSSYKPNSNGDNIYYYFYISFYYLSLFFLSLNNLLLCERQSVVSDSLRLHGLYSPSNSPGQNTGVGSHSLLQGIFPTQGSNPGLLHCRWIPYQLSHHYYTWVLTLCLCMVLQATQASFHSALQRKQLASF